MAQRPALGKGLASLLGPSAHVSSIQQSVAQAAAANEEIQNAIDVQGKTEEVPEPHAVTPKPSGADRIPGVTLAQIQDITPNPYQPRREFDEAALQELAASIRSNGIIQPIVVRRSDHGFQIIAGERRFRAAQIAGLKQVPVVVRKSSDREALEVALIENIQRQDLNCIDEALAYSQLIDDFSLTHEDLAERVGKDRSTVANFLRLLKLPEAVLDDLKCGHLSLGHGKLLLSLEDRDLILMVRKQIIEQRLSVRAAEGLVDQIKRGQNKAVSSDSKLESVDPVATSQGRLKKIGDDLTRLTGSRVEFKGTDRRGKITIRFHSSEDLERWIRVIQKGSVT